MSAVEAGLRPVPEAPRVDVVMVNYRGWEAVVRAVDHLRRSDRPAGVGWPHGVVHVVDNSEDEQEALALREALAHWPEVRLHVLARNVGFGAGCNAAWAASDAPFVLLLNPDAQITAEEALQLAQALREQPGLAAVSPRTWWDRPGGWVLPCPTPQEPWARWRRAAASRRDAAGWADEQVAITRRLMASFDAVDVAMLAGAVLMLRRSAVESLGCSFGLFDPEFFMYFEDADLSARLRHAGWKLAVVPTVDAVHAWRHQPHKAPLMARGEAVFMQRHSWAYRALRRLWPGMEHMGRLPGDVMRLLDAQQALRVLGSLSALSPVPSGDPAWVRWGPAVPLMPDEWNLLEPGHYWAQTDRGWVGFEKVSGAALQSAGQ
jgi:GT2 family glycosyltransferase